MFTLYHIRIFLILFIFFPFITSCKKFLEEKPDKNLVVPDNISDLQALLDNNYTMNSYGSSIGEASSDNYYLSSADWSSLYSQADKNIYIWEKEIAFDIVPNEWSRTYQTIYYANVALENIDKLNRDIDASAWDNVKGSALFYRAKSHHSIAVNWAKAYDSTTASADLGIPLRLNSDFNEATVRSSLGEAFSSILSDLYSSSSLLPVVPANGVRPSKAAAFGLISRVFLSMGDYRKAALYSDSCLQLHASLLNFNNLDTSAAYPISMFNEEVIMQGSMILPDILNNSRAKIDTNLYRSYAENDLRKTVFFRTNTDSSFAFRGSYNGSNRLFAGVAADEVFLTKAESLARLGMVSEAMSTLNTLLETRWKTGTFIPLSATGEAEALATILAERRKELLMRDIRWMDIKRLNKEGANISLERVINGKTYRLIPNDPKFALPIPAYVVNLSGIPQNSR